MFTAAQIKNIQDTADKVGEFANKIRGIQVLAKSHPKRPGGLDFSNVFPFFSPKMKTKQKNRCIQFGVTKKPKSKRCFLIPTKTQPFCIGGAGWSQTCGGANHQYQHRRVPGCFFKARKKSWSQKSSEDVMCVFQHVTFLWVRCEDMFLFKYWTAGSLYHLGPGMGEIAQEVANIKAPSPSKQQLEPLAAGKKPWLVHVFGCHLES